MTICPCCGSRSAGDLREGCTACGARAVGPPLARPERELPSYGRALFVCAAGALLLVTFLAGTFVALWEKWSSPVGFWKVVAAAETAAWRLKFAALPWAALAVWVSARLRASIRREPARFAGLRLAHAGLAMSAVVALSGVVLIAVTVPERLRQRELARQAADNALAYAAHRILLEYSARFGTLPSAPQDLDKLSSDDPAIKKVREMLKEGVYLPEASLASLPPTRKERGRRVKALRVSSTTTKNSTDDLPGEGLSLTNYTLVLPGRDGLLDTDDDIWVRDGLRIQAPPPAKRPFPSPSLVSDRKVIP